MPPKPPPPPQPDPVTLDQIYENIVSASSDGESRAYHIVALNTVAFHPTVKLFLFEHQLEDDVAGEGPAESIREANRLRRETLIKSIAFFLALRTSPVSRECRWETMALLGELCRMEQTAGPSKKGGPSPSSELETQLNGYARANLEYLAKLPWFRNTLLSIVGDGKERTSEDAGSSREAIRRKLKERLDQQGREEPDEWEESDEDVKIAIRDVLRALPTIDPASSDKDIKVCWTPENLEQAHDLMFLDASTTMAHLIPMVCRCLKNTCASCLKKVSSEVVQGSTATEGFLRCSACKAVFYCSPKCQKVHWGLAHKVPCLAYKEFCSKVLNEYYALNAKKKKRDAQKGSVTILEVPLEPSLFFETRQYLYDHRDSSFSNVSFNDYFLKYTVRGN